MVAKMAAKKATKYGNDFFFSRAIGMMILVSKTMLCWSQNIFNDNKCRNLDKVKDN